MSETECHAARIAAPRSIHDNMASRLSCATQAPFGAARLSVIGKEMRHRSPIGVAADLFARRAPMAASHETSIATRGRLFLEFLVLFGGGPLFLLFLRRPGALFAVLWLSAALAWFSVRRSMPVPHDPRQ